MSGEVGQNLPVFVFPTQLQFVVEDPASHKQVLTIYNPYEFPIHFRVLCTASENYSVVEPEGIIRPKCSVDVVVRHQAVNRGGNSRSDVFRININEQGNRQVKGYKDVPSSLQECATDAAGPSFQNVSSSRQSARDHPSRSRHISEPQPPGRSSSLMVVAGLVCICALSLPTQSDKSSVESTVPLYLHLSVPQKLVAAYALGLITALIFKFR